MRRSGAPLLVLLAAAALPLLLGPTACNVVAGLSGLTFVPDDAGASCLKDGCDDQEPCTTDTCDAMTGLCAFTPLEDGASTPGATDTPGDCKKSVCQGGTAAVVDDDTDVPNAQGDCQSGTCKGGIPGVDFLAKNTACAGDGGAFCDGMGLCVGCNEDAQCGPTNECQLSQCQETKCSITFTPDKTPVKSQIPGDCKADVCDGAGNVVTIDDDADTEADGNPCTDDVCMAGVLSHPSSAIDTACGASLVCDGMGNCVGCTNDMQCNAPETCGGCGVAGMCCCKPKTCADLGLHCGAAPDGCGAMLSCNDGKNGGETDVDCGGPSCSVKCGNGKACASGSDCQSGACVDGVCCSSACNGPCMACNLPGSPGTCKPVLNAIDNNPPNACAGGSACDGTGVCKKLDGQPCPGGNVDCLSGSCADGVCCDKVCNGVCEACTAAKKGAGMNGACDFIQVGQDPDMECAAPKTCNGAGACQ
ncbi:MAG: hypothetical protein U0359_11915 [Byssovorax sp.]